MRLHPCAFILVLLAFGPASVRASADEPTTAPVAGEDAVVGRMMQAAEDGEVEAVKRILAGGAAVDMRDAENRTALHHAAEKGHSEVCELLIQRGAQVDSVDQDEMTPLHCAAEWGREEVCQLLLDKGADVNARDRHDGKPSHTSLALAAMHQQDELVPLLLKHKADVNAADHDGNSPLHLAAAIPFTPEESVQALVRAGAKIDARNNKGESALLVAITQTGRAPARALVELGADVNLADETGLTPLLAAVTAEEDEMAETLIAKGADVNTADRKGSTPLLMAAAGGQAEIVTLLLDRGARTPALRRGRTLLHYAADSGNVETVRIVIERIRSELDALDEEGFSALDYAARAKEPAAADLLRRRKAHTGQQIRWSRYVAPRIAARPTTRPADPPVDADSEAKAMEEARQFLAGGGKVDAIVPGNWMGFTRLHLAAFAGQVELAKWLLDKGADPNHIGSGNGGRTPLHCAGSRAIAQLLVDRGAKLDTTARDDWVAIHSAASEGSAAVVQWLIEKGQKPDALDLHRFTPLHLASSAEVAELLIRNGADVNARTYNVPEAMSFSSHPHRATPLHIAAAAGRAEVARVLIEYGAPINATNGKGRTPLAEAVEEYRRTAKWLIEEQAKTQPSQRVIDFRREDQANLLETIRVLMRAGAEGSVLKDAPEPELGGLFREQPASRPADAM